MKYSRYIIVLVSIIMASLAATSCLQKESPCPNGPESGMANITLKFDVGAEAAVKSDTQGNQIKSITVWAYKYEDSSIPDNSYPIGFAKKEFNLSSGSQNLTLQMPAADLEDSKIRFLAIANASEYGEIFKARQNYSDEEEPLELNASITYKELVTAVFDAKDEDKKGILWQYPTQTEPPVYMPLSHWTDVENLADNPSVTIQLYRAVAKTEFYAKLGNSSSGGLVHINYVTIRSSKDYAIPSEGFVFSSNTEVNSSTSPAVFGAYSNVFVNIPYFNIKNSSDFPVAVTSTGELVAVGSNFLYENFFGQEFSGADLTSPENYNTGAYYMEVSYSYGLNDNGSFVVGTQKIVTSYVPLPRIVRNHNYKIEAEFNFNVDGNVMINYKVGDTTGEGDGIVIGQWTDVAPTELEFAYPTFKVSAIKTIKDPVTGNDILDYSQPVAKYHKEGENPPDDTYAFGFTFQIKGCSQWTVALADNKDGENEKFSLKVLKKSGNNPAEVQTVTDNSFTETSIEYNNIYTIKVYPNYTEYNNIRTANIYISYPAEWLGGNDELLINSGGGGTLWSDSGGERYMIKVTQPAAE